MVGTSTRGELIEAIARWVAAAQLDHPVRVAVDGRSAAGKTSFAGELAAALERLGRTPVRASIDDFHPPGHSGRSAGGGYTPESYYDEGFEYARFRAWVCDPCASGGSRRLRLRYWNSFEDARADVAEQSIPDDGILVVDGAFLFRPELEDCWDRSVWLHVEFDEMIRRAIPRDSAFVGDPEVVRRRYETRYVPLHRLYEKETGAPGRVDLEIDHGDPAAPRILRGPELK